MARYRGTTAQRGLGGDHAADKKRLLALHRDGDPCWRCGKPMFRWQALDRDHVIDRALGGTMGPAVLAHASCNRSAGARLGNQLRPYTMGATPPGRDTICGVCGKIYSRAPRRCEICGAHYHPNHGEQRTCSRTCGVQLRRRKYNGRQSSKPPPKPRRAAEPYAPRGTVTYYTCRYCGRLGVAHGTGQRRREVCPARACQLARLANRAPISNELTPDAPWWTSVQPHRARDAAEPPVHLCPGCGERTARYRWCDICLCVSVNIKGKRCGNPASTDGKCDYHSAQDGHRVAAREW